MGRAVGLPEAGCGVARWLPRARMEAGLWAGLEAHRTGWPVPYGEPELYGSVHHRPQPQWSLVALVKKISNIYIYINVYIIY